MPPKNAHAASQPGDHRGRRLRERQEHEAVPGQHRGEHQRVQLPAPVPVADHPQVAEVQLHLLAGLPVGHRHRHPRPRRAVPALLSREPRQRPVRHRRTGPLQQLPDLHQRQASLHPGGDLGLPRHQRLPRGAVPSRAGRAHRRDHLPEQLIGQLRLIPVAGQARRPRRVDIPAGGLHVHARPPGRRALARPGQPRPQDLSHLCHQNLPERHSLPSLPVRNEPEDHSRVVHQLATQVVPSPWQQPSAGGPMLMADDNPGLRSAMKARAWRARAQRATKVALIPGPSDRPVVLVAHRRSAAGLNLGSGNWLTSVRLRLAAIGP